MLWIYFFVFAALACVLFLILMRPALHESGQSSDKLITGLGVSIAIISLIIYWQRGALDELALLEKFELLSDTEGSFPQENQTEILRDIEAYVSKNSEDAEYWFLLAGVQMQMQDYTGAVSSYEKASELVPADTSLYPRIAEAQFLADGYVLTDKTRNYVDQALANDPNDPSVLGILGISAFRIGQYDAAIQFWERSLQSLPPFSAAAESVRASIQQAREAAGGMENDDQLAEVPAELEAGLRFQVNVSLAEGISYQPSDTVFVFARQFGGPPMPVVVQRLVAGQLPLSIVLDDSMVMIQGTTLANYPQLELVARLSFDGAVTASSGDYETVFGPVNPAEITAPISLQIADRVD